MNNILRRRLITSGLTRTCYWRNHDSTPTRLSGSFGPCASVCSGFDTVQFNEFENPWIHRWYATTIVRGQIHSPSFVVGSIKIALERDGFLEAKSNCTGIVMPIAVRMFAKGSKNKEKKASLVSDDTNVVDIDFSDNQKMMEKAIEHLQHELANIRTGRATPGMLDHLKVDAYGEKMPLKALASVTVRDAQLLVVTLFDAGLIDKVISCIEKSPLQLNPRKEGNDIFVPIPTPTGEMLVAMAKMCKSEGEDAKISIRHARKAAMDAIKNISSEDERHRLEKEIQAMTDKYIAEAESIVANKQSDIKKHRN